MIVRRGKRTRFTVIENRALEDDRLSFKALGVLAYLLSRPDNWEANYRHLATVRGEGEFAVRGALAELETAGYVSRRRERDSESGQWRWVQVIKECADCDDEPGGEDHAAVTAARSPDHAAVSHAAVSHAAEIAARTKKEVTTTEELSEPDGSRAPPLFEGFTIGSDEDPDFARFWSAYPRRVDKGAARRAWRAAVKKQAPADIAEAAARFAADPNLPAEASFVPHPATWLNGERWDDGPLPPRRGRGRAETVDDRKAAIAAAAREAFRRERAE